MVAFAGLAYNSTIDVSVVSDHPTTLGSGWLSGRAVEDFNVDDGAYAVYSPGLVSSRAFVMSSEGALEWYSDFVPSRGLHAAITTLPGISRMYLPSPSSGYGYALVFHIADTDCGTKNTVISGSRDLPTIVSGGIAQYSATAATVFVAARVALDGSMEVYIRPTTAAQEIRLFERTSSTVLQNVLLATAAAGTTVRLQFSPSSTFAPYVPPKAAPLAALLPLLSGVPAPFQCIPGAVAVVVQDRESGGWGEYPFKVEGLTGSQKARVTLLRARDKMVVRQVWSAADGTGMFTGLDVATKYIALAEAPDGSMHPVAAAHCPRLPGGA